MDLTTGQILVSALDFAPTGTFACNGQLVPMSANKALFELLGTTYGGDGVTTFAVPDIPTARFGPGGPPVGYSMVASGAPYPSGMEALLGEVRLFPMTPPAGSTLAQTWLPCDGRLLTLDVQSEQLYSLLGTVYGGDGITTFALPNLPHVVVARGPPLPYWICTGGMYPPDYGDSLTPKYPDSFFFDLYMGTLVQLGFGEQAIDRIPGLALCRGQTLPIASPWDVLFSLLGTNFGGNGITTFALPTLPSAPTGPGIVPCELVISGLYPPRM
jgi:microcystin-dependent protein